MPGTKRTLLVVGCGNMGAAIAAGASRRGDLRLIGLDPDIERAGKLRSSCPDITPIGDIAELGERRPDRVVLAMKPALVPSTLTAARNRIADALVISIAAGVPLPSSRRPFRTTSGWCARCLIFQPRSEPA
jgi:pyrroline-5-carboxylate reductase